MAKLYQIQSGKACGGVVTYGEIVVRTASYFKFMMNRKISSYFRKLKIVLVSEFVDYVTMEKGGD